MKECTLPPLSNLCTAILESLLAFIVAPTCTSLQAHLDVPRLRPPELAAVTVFVVLGAALGMATTAAGHLCCWLVRSWCPAGSQPSLGASSQARHNSPATSLLTRVVTDSLFVDSCLMPPVFGGNDGDKSSFLPALDVEHSWLLELWFNRYHENETDDTQHDFARAAHKMSRA